MTHLANVVVVMDAGDAATSLAQRLTENALGYQLVSEVASVLPALQQCLPDLLVVAETVGGEKTYDMLSAVRSASQTAFLPVLFLSSTPLADCGERLLEIGIDDALPLSTPSAIVLHHLRPLVRISTMRCELALRQQQAEALGVSLEVDADYHPDTEGRPRILVLGSSAAEQMTLQALQGEDVPSDAEPTVDIVRTPDLFEAQRLMESHRFDACVMVGEDHLQPLLDLCLQIRRNPRLFNLPVIFLMEGTEQDTIPRPLRVGASHVLSLTPNPQELSFALKVVIARQRTRWTIRRDLLDTLDCRVVDPKVSEVYSSAFLRSYLEARVVHSITHQRQLSLVGFNFAGVDAIRHEFGRQAETHLLDQIGQWLTLLVRAEDLVARLDGAHFIVTLPDTPLAEAQVVMNRIAGVMSNTDFAVHDVYRVVNVWPYVRGTTLQEGDTCDSLLARARVAYDEEALLSY